MSTAPISACHTKVVEILKSRGIIDPWLEFGNIITSLCNLGSASIIADYLYRFSSWKILLNKLLKQDPNLTSEELEELEKLHHNGDRQNFIEYLFELRKKHSTPTANEQVQLKIIQNRIKSKWKETISEIEQSGKLTDYSNEEIFSDLVILNLSAINLADNAISLRKKYPKL